MAQSINEQIGTLTTVEAKLHFCDISRKMLCADLVPASDDSAFQERECGFNGVSVTRAPFS